LVFASFKLRLFAHLVDILILSAITILLTKATLLTNERATIFNELSGLIISCLYYSTLTASNIQGTIGKKLMHIQVVDTNLQRLSLKHSFGRYLSYYFSYITLGFGFIMIIFTKNKTGLHDKIAKTYVTIKN